MTPDQLALIQQAAVIVALRDQIVAQQQRIAALEAEVDTVTTVS